MNADHFYITLFSNSSMDCYPENTLTSFTVALARTVVLGGNDRWEVGICKFLYTSVPEYNVIHGSYAFIYGDSSPHSPWVQNPCDVFAQSLGLARITSHFTPYIMCMWKNTSFEPCASNSWEFMEKI